MMFPIKRPSFINSMTYGRRILEWYVGGYKIPNLEDCILGVWAGMNSPITEIEMFPKTIFAENSSEELYAPENPELNISDIPGCYSGIQATDTRTSLTNSDIINWYKYMMKGLTASSETDQISDINKTTLNYLGYLLFITMTATVKDSKKVSNHILKSGSLKFKTFWKIHRIPSKSIPPHRDAFNYFKLIVDKGTHNCSKLMIALLESYRSNIEEFHREALMSSCLLSLKFVGLGCLKWLLQASHKLNICPSSLMKYLAIRSNRRILTDLCNVIIKHVSVETEITWPWARMIKDEALSCIRISRNPRFAAGLMSIVLNHDTTSILWDQPHFRMMNKTNIIIYAKAVETAVRETDVEITLKTDVEIAQDLLHILKKN